MKRYNNSGFTLLEVMVALFVVAIALGGAIKVMGNAAQNTSRLSNKTFAQWVGLNQIAKLKTTKAWPKYDETNGESEMASQKWKWVQKTIKTEDANIKRVEVSVRLVNDSDSNPFATVVGFLAKP
ncbi:MAG: type II secretion system minor pseudopilin GspI [Thiotrichaceae bacterium]|nr:type II secretion system minor pseudopilin GspI [Thiotrichaceae bacterium]